MLKRVKKFLSLLIILSTLLGSLGNTCNPCGGGGKDADPEPIDLEGEDQGGNKTVSFDFYFHF